MLTDAPVSAVLPATDMKRAKDFYQNKLGLKLLPTPMGGEAALFLAGKASTLLVYVRPEPTKAEHTAAGFLVPSVAEAVKELEAKGVKFEDYDMPGLKTVGHIVDYKVGKSAWFKDTEGNIIALNEMQAE